MNLQDLSDEALDGLRIEVLTEQERRRSDRRASKRL